MKWNWEGFTAKGDVTDGVIEAETMEDAAGMLRQKNIFTRNISPRSEPNAPPPEIRSQETCPQERAEEPNEGIKDRNHTWKDIFAAECDAVKYFKQNYFVPEGEDGDKIVQELLLRILDRAVQAKAKADLSAPREPQP